VYLKSLTLRGFKSFAGATTLTLEPGVTAVVGPNGSGKSNVVDAIAWVMGEQGAKSLRGGKMEDVIFAGTRSRPPLGRAEVRLTIDNSDGALPIDYAEVTISRTMFRSGGSEYAINGTACRLVDVQDLLSDSGMGREMHVVVGQGQLDAILSASPEERRGFIEEAAGVLKHRKRKERALRKIEATQANLVRLTDLTGEIRRQLAPLARQADVARRAHAIAAEARDARARLLADDLAQLQAQLAADVADESALVAQREEVSSRLASARAAVVAFEAEAAAAAPAVSEASEVWYRLSALRERVRGTRGLARERVRLLGVADFGGLGADPQELEETAVRLAREAEALEAEATTARETASAAGVQRQAAEKLADEAARREANRLREAADRREEMAIQAGIVAAARSTVEARQAEIERLRGRLAEAEQAGTQARLEFTALEGQIAGVEAGEVDLDAAHEASVEALELARSAHEAAVAARGSAEREVAALTARVETLDLSLARADGAGALLASPPPGLLGSLAALVDVSPGWEAAVAAALGRAAAAVAVESPEAAVDAIRSLRADDGGRAGFLIASPEDVVGSRGKAPAGAVWASDVVKAPTGLQASVDHLLAGVVLVESLSEARAVIVRDGGVVAVTRGGDVLAPTWAEGGSAAGKSLLELQVAHDEAVAELAEATAALERGVFEIARLDGQRDEAVARAEETLGALHESDARFAAVADRLGRLSARMRSADEEVGRLTEAVAEAGAALEMESAALEEAAAGLEEARTVNAGDEVGTPDGAEAVSAGDETGPAEEDGGDRDGLAELTEAVEAARAAETEARLTARTCEERARALRARVEATQRAASTEREARAAAAEREARREEGARVARAVAEGAAALEEMVAAAQAEAGARRERIEAERAEREAQLVSERKAAEEAVALLGQLTDVAHRDEMARAAVTLRIEQTCERAIEELGLDGEELIAQYGPDRLVPLVAGMEAGAGEATDPAAHADPAVQAEQGTPYVREDQEKRLRKAERALAVLGKVNPLALEEYAALEERHRFLSDQLTDVKKSMADLHEVIREIDGRVEQVFGEAFADTCAAFARVFERLFPGGEGRIIATTPDDMLLTGVDIEARPAGKAVKRLSLLSGGERALVAVAFVIAIFLARPSPFYVLDEVEAALDDTNLDRLLAIIAELRSNSQILLVTHQKRTMEIADALYGVTMKDDGVTHVVSQRLGSVS